MDIVVPIATATTVPSISIVIPHTLQRREATAPDVRFHFRPIGAPSHVLRYRNTGGGRWVEKDGTAELVERYTQQDGRIRLIATPAIAARVIRCETGCCRGRVIGFCSAMPTVCTNRRSGYAAERRKEVQHRNCYRLASSRSLDGGRAAILVARISGRTFNLIMRIATGLPFRDTQCGFKLYSRNAAQAVFTRQTLDGFRSTWRIGDRQATRFAGCRGGSALEQCRRSDGERAGIKSFVDWLRFG